MVRTLWLILTLLLSTIVVGQDRQLSQAAFDSTTKVLKNHDDAEGFVYAFVDQYLANPTEERLIILERYEQEIWRSLVTADEKLAYVILLCNKGYYLTQYAKVYSAIDAYEKAWQIFDYNHLSDFDIIEYCLKPLANNYSILGDYATASNLIKQYLFLAQRQKNQEHILAAFINLAIIYHDTGKPAEAIKLLEEGINIKTKNFEKLGLLYSGLAMNYERLNDIVKAKNFAAKALSVFGKDASDNMQHHAINTYRMLAMLSIRGRDEKEALRFIKSAQQLASSRPKLLQNREWAKLNNSYAEILAIQKQFEDALQTYKKSLTVLLPSYNATSQSLPDATSLYPENAIKETLDGMASVYVSLGDPERALSCYELAFATEDLLRDVYNYEDAKLLQQLENRSRTEKVLLILYDLALKTKREAYITRAFQIAERTKAITLRENIEDRFLKTKIKSDPLILQENELRFRQAKISNQIVIEQMKLERADVTRINQLVEDQNKITQSIKTNEKAIATKYPNIRRESSNQVDTNVLHQRLKNDQALLVEYFIGEESLFVFTISENSISIKKSDDLKSIRKDILELHDLFSSAASINKEVKRYQELAFSLHEKLCLPTDTTRKNLIIIPDGILTLIPFDALLYQRSVSSTQYAAFPYLLKRYSIAYQPSASLYSKGAQRSVNSADQHVLAMFPVFEKTNRTLSYSMKESEGMQNYIEGKYLHKQNASMNAFMNNVGEFPLIHLSTHAAAGDEITPPSITFIDSTLYLPQIYGLQISTDLLVLSACETGTGVLVRGEGAISLARGFQFAGVKNIIFSLWRVNDFSTATLMVNFYREYENIKSKHEALRQAKLSYLADDNISNLNKSPYYWSGFVYYGDVEPLAETNHAWDKIIVAIAIIIAGLEAAYLVAKKRSRV